MEADCNESFSDFQTKKSVIRKISTQNKHVKKKKICASQPISLSECTVNNNKDIKAESHVKEVYCTSSSKTTESSLNSGNDTERKIIAESTCETAQDISSNEVTSSSKPVIISPNSDVGIYQEKNINNFECVKKYVLNDAAISPPEWMCVICQKSVWQQDMQSHFANCIKVYGHKGSSVGSSHSENIPSPFICDVCKWDITHLSVQERCEHINKCLDSKPINDDVIKQDESSTTQSTITITECPLCFRNCSSVEARLIHIKKCSKALGIDVPSVIVALQLQQKHTAERISLGLPPVQTRPAIKKTSEKLPKKVVPVPKSENDANIQLAKALSLSAQEETAAKQQELEEFTDIDLLKFNFPKGTPLHLKPPKTEEKPGKRKKKNVNKPVPLLLLRTDEERQKLLEERVSSIIIPQCQTESSEKESKFSHEKCPLWVLCGMAEEKMSYYVQDIREFVTPSELEAGSKLRSLSQVPGHRIFTQQPCDYTFNYSQESEVNVPSPKAVLTIPSTQEMLDVIVSIDDDDEVDNKQDHDQAIECLSTQQSGSDKNHGKHEQCAKENDGFFCEEYDNETTFNPVIDSLMTLVGSTWLSDVDIIVSGGETIPAHALLLKLRCPALQMSLNVSQEERMVLDWKDVSHDTACHFLRYIYTGIRKWPSSLNAEVEHLIEQCKMKPDEKMDSKSAKDDTCKRSFHEKSPHRNQFCKQFSSPNFVLKKQNSCFSPEGYSNQQDSGNACMISQKVNGRHTIFHVPDPFSTSTKDVYDSYGSEGEPDISVFHEVKPVSLERPMHVKTVMSISNSVEHQSTSACSQDLFECETDDDKLCDMASVDTFSIKKSSDTIRESSKLNDTLVKNDIISYKANKSCHKMYQDAKCTSTFESQKVLPERAVTYSDVVITVEEPCNNNTKLSSGENSKDIIESKSLTDKNEDCRDGLYNCNDVLSISNDDEDNNYIDAVTSPSPPKNCSNAPKCSREIPKDTCLARSPVSSVVVSAMKVGTLSPSHMSSNLNTLDISKISRKILRKNYSESSIAFSTPLSKTAASASFSETKLPASQVRKNIFGSTEELRTSYCNMQMQRKSASETLSTTEPYFPQGPMIDKVSSLLHSPIVLSSDEEIDSAHLNDGNEALTFQPEKIGRNSNECSPISYSQVRSQMKFELSDDEVELVPLHMRVANVAGKKCDDEDVQIIPLPSMDYMKSNERTSVTRINICNGSPTPVSSTVENKAVECETSDHLLHSKKLPVSGIQISNSPVTPLPDYKGMVTPDIKMALRKYGIRALPKKQAVALLTHIYEETHPWVELEEEGPAGACLGPSVSTDSYKANKKRKAIEIKHKISPCREPCAKKSKLKKDKVSKTIMKKALSEEDNVLSSSQSSRSDIEDMLEESYDESEAEICSQGTSDSTKTLLYDFIRTNNDLYSKVLQYEPLNLANLHQELKENGIKISSTQLMDFLDEECITFTLPRSEKYKKKQQARTQKFRKRMIAQLSQPNAQNIS